MRYLLKFKKYGYSIYTSHLDIMRLFNRSFKRANIQLLYSQGFNPHPKMSFAQPLSLGYKSNCEYLEFDTKESFKTDTILEKLKNIMPEGIEITECQSIKQEGKTMAALVTEVSYSILIPNRKSKEGYKDQDNSFNDFSEKFTQEEAKKVLVKYLNQEKVLAKKFQKKSGKEIEIDIKPMIFNVDIEIDHNYIKLTASLAAGSNLNLSPEQLISSFCDFAYLDIQRYEVKVTREEILFK